MRISTILDHVDSGHMALPEFQRGYVWNRDQVRSLMDSLYRRHPVGSLLVWVTKTESAQYRGDAVLPPGVVKLLLDGQQRITSLYGILRGKAPPFFDGNAQAFSGLHFHVDSEDFSFYQPIKMADDPCWIDVSQLMGAGMGGLGNYITKFSGNPTLALKVGQYAARLSQVLGIRDIELHVEEVTGTEKTIDVVVDIFNRVNSGGTKLSKGDLALAKICAECTEARDMMKQALKGWAKAGYRFDLDWLLRNTNTILTGEAKFLHLHDISADKVKDGLKRAEKAINYLLNVIDGRLGLDHDRVFFGRYAMPVMAHYLDRRGGHFDDEKERDKLLFWYLQSAMWGRFSGSTESVIDKDLETMDNLDGALDRLLSELRLSHSFEVMPAHFTGWSLGARFYPVLYMLTRVGEARDWGTGLPLKSSLLGKMNKLEVHHVFPRDVLYKHKFGRAQVNAVANFCFLTKDTNIKISNRLPEDYFPEIETKHPGALASQWIPMDRQLWKIKNYPDFLEARRKLLSDATNALLGELLHGEPLVDPSRAVQRTSLDGTPIAGAEADRRPPVPGGMESEEEEQQLTELNEWMIAQGLPEGASLFELSEPDSGTPLAILDLAWPNGIQEGFGQPVAVLLNETPAVLQAANSRGYRYFTTVEAFKRYVRQDVLGDTVVRSNALALQCQ